MSATTIAGYGDPTYAAALSHIGEAVAVGPSTLLRRAVPTGNTDLVAPYPLLRCNDWQSLGDALETAEGDLSVTGVTDPFSDPGPEILSSVFPDLTRAWKDHHIVDLAAGDPPSSHHRRNLRKAEVDVVRAAPATAATETLITLYDVLRRRHGVNGAADFPPASLRAQLAVPGARAWVAHADDEPAAVVVAYVEDECAWYHLGAASATGYERRAMYALFAAMIHDLAADGCRSLDLGAGAGTDQASAGLERFKRGWAHQQRPTHLVGRILDPGRYQAAVEAAGGPHAWFPAYRDGES